MLLKITKILVLSFFLSKPEHHIFHIHNIYFIIIEKLFPKRSRGPVSAIDATTGGSLPASTTIQKMVSISCNSKFKNSILYQNIYIVFFI